MADSAKRASQSFAAEEVILLDRMLYALKHDKDGDLRQLVSDSAFPGLARAVQRMKKTSGL